MNKLARIISKELEHQSEWITPMDVLIRGTQSESL